MAIYMCAAYVCVCVFDWVDGAFRCSQCVDAKVHVIVFGVYHHTTRVESSICIAHMVYGIYA